MSGQFKVGEVLVGQNLTVEVWRNGMDCIVIGPLEVRSGVDLLGRYAAKPQYLVEWADGQTTNVAPNYLRRKQPPAGEESILRMFNQPTPQTEPA